MSRLGRLLLRLYPAEFRAEFGEEVDMVFQDSWRASGSGPRAWPARGRILIDLVDGVLIQRRRVPEWMPGPFPLRTPTATARWTMRDLFMEFRHAFRSLARVPGFSLTVILTLGLGIGANSAIFSVVDGVLLRPAPLESMDRLTLLWETDRKSGTTREPASIPDYFDFLERSARYERIAAFSPIVATLAPNGGDPVRAAGLWVTHEFLPLMGIRPLLGHVFSAEQDQPDGPAVVLIGEAMWTERFARSPTIVGTSIRVNDALHVIVGVLPASADFGTLQVLGAAAYRRGFADQGGRVRVDVWLPMQASRDPETRGNHPIFMIGRLGRGISIGLAQAELTSIALELERTYRESNDGRGVHVEPVAEVVFGKVKPALLVLIGAVSLVLLVACANVANLWLARGAGRAHEVRVRTALGASLGRLTRQFLMESAILTGAGAIAGLILAVAGLRLLLAFAPGTIPRLDMVGIDARVLTVTFVLATIVGVTFGMVPAFQVWQRGNNLSPQTSAARGASAGLEQRRFRSALVVAELALAVILMVGAGLLIKSLWRLYQVDPGFRSEGVLKAEFQLNAKYPQRMSDWPKWREIRGFTTEVRNRVAALPGVTGVTIAGNHPLEAGYTSSISIVGREAEAADWPEPAIRRVDAGYQETMGVALVAGRGLSDSDDLEATPVVAINEAARARFFGDRPALGQRIQFWGLERTVVGIYADERFRGPAEAAMPALYLPTGQAPVPNGSILVRVDGDPMAMVSNLRRVVREVDPEIPLYAIERLTETLSRSTAERQFTMLVLGVFATVALLLAMIGVHGVLSYTVAQRTREIGIRMALGADRRSVRGLVFGQGARLAAGGLTIGILGAIGVARLLSKLLYGVHPNDPVTIAAVATSLGGVALLASWLPARRAAAVEPLVALRME